MTGTSARVMDLQPHRIAAAAALSKPKPRSAIGKIH